MLNPAGADVSVGIAEIASVRIVRPSQAGKGALWGGLGGALVGGVLGGLSGGMDEYSAGQAAVMIGFIFGGIGCLGGLGVGTLLSVDTNIAIAGESEALARSRLGDLLPFSREYRRGGRRMKLEISPAPVPAPRPSVQTPEAAGAAPPVARRAPRFRVRLPYTIAIRPPYHYDDSDRRATTFSFPGNATDPGPLPTELIRHQASQNRSGLDSFSLGYELSDRLAVEVEVVFGHWGAYSSDGGSLRFTSVVDGITYEQDAATVDTRRFSAALVGLTYRPAAPTEFRRHIVEAGLAVGPAWARFQAEEWSFGQTGAPSGRVTLAARAHAAYDFYAAPTVSFGVAVGYRYFRVALPASTAAATLTFHDTAEYPTAFLERMTELAVPARTVDASGFYIGLRTGLRF